MTIDIILSLVLVLAGMLITMISNVGEKKNEDKIK